MKRLTSIEKGVLIIATFLFFGGLYSVLWPEAGVVVHFTNDVWGSPDSSIESVSTSGSRVYGILAMLVGSGLAALAVYRGKA